LDGTVVFYMPLSVFYALKSVSTGNKEFKTSDRSELDTFDRSEFKLEKFDYSELEKLDRTEKLGPIITFRKKNIQVHLKKIETHLTIS